MVITVKVVQKGQIIIFWCERVDQHLGWLQLVQDKHWDILSL